MGGGDTAQKGTRWGGVEEIPCADVQMEKSFLPLGIGAVRQILNFFLTQLHIEGLEPLLWFCTAWWLSNQSRVTHRKAAWQAACDGSRPDVIRKCSFLLPFNLISSRLNLPVPHP